MALILKSKTGQKLVKHLARPIVAQIAPEELEDFDDLAEDYFADPRLESDDTLGAGLGLLPDLVVVLAFVGPELQRPVAVSGDASRKGKGVEAAKLHLPRRIACCTTGDRIHLRSLLLSTQAAEVKETVRSEIV